MKQLFVFILIFFYIIPLLTSCESKRSASGRVEDTVSSQEANQAPAKTPAMPAKNTQAAEAERRSRIAAIQDSLQRLPDSSFIPLLALDSSFVPDMKYATSDNFLKTQVYDCDQCFLRKEVANGLIRAQEMFKEHGYRIKLFDCYRPFDVQKKMWVIMPDDRYVANPLTKGSIHNRGAAVDISLVDEQGNELDMGTPFDFFGRESHHAYQKLPAQVLANRRLLKETMEAAGFNSITSEWWHYSYQKNGYPIANFKPVCLENGKVIP